MNQSLFYLLASVATLSMIPPLIVAARRWSMLPRARQFLAAQVALAFVMDAGMFALGRMGLNNLWIAHIGEPLQTALILCGFSFWQRHEVARLALRVSVPLVLMLWLTLTIGFENATQFSRFSAPFQSILLVAVAAYTVVTCAAVATDPLPLHDWFWFGVGIMLYYGTYAIVEPVSQLLIPSAPGRVWTIFGVRAIIAVFVNLLYLKGMLCRVTPPSFGGFSSRPPSWSPSSSLR
ncbi:MAG: hypothetical protein ABJD11_11450 [Gemmatimonadota bacterium]